MDYKQTLEYIAKGAQVSSDEDKFRLKEFIERLSKGIDSVSDEHFRTLLVTETKMRFSGYVSEYSSPKLFTYLGIMNSFIELAADKKLEWRHGLKNAYEQFEYERLKKRV